MNVENVLFHLREAKQELNATITEMEKSEDYDDGEFMVAMMHLYHHLNTAWNSRNASPERVEQCTQEDFHRWRQFPDDLPLN